MPQTGATRYQKFLKSEKSKTKLKSKKELPKGTNVTKTNFKVKKIVIKEQLKKHGENEALSIRKLNVKELLARLNHFNVHSRMDALSGIKELITAFPDVLENNLGHLIHGVTPLILNIERSVRRETLKVLHLILSNTNTTKIEPFFDILSTYLRSAMTHIDNSIQEDSLLFLDILLLCAAERVSKDFHKILPNFLDMISKLRVDSKPGRTLTVNLNSQLTSVKWRVKVLQRLQDFLSKYVDTNKIGGNKAPLHETTQVFNNSKLNYFPLANPSYISDCTISIFSSKTSESLLIDEGEKFKSYIDTLMPLLFETWLEVCPNSIGDKNTETVITEDAAILLKRILHVISLIWELVQHLQKKNMSSQIKMMFSDSFRKGYTQHIVKHFPYVTNIRSSKSNSQSNTGIIFEDYVRDPKMTEENLAICHLYILFNPNANINNHGKDIKPILNYIERTFNGNSQDAVKDLVTKVLHTIFSNELTGWNRNLTIMDALLRKIIWTYFNESLAQSFKQNIFTLLCKVALNDKLVHFHDSDAFEKWIKSLPDILLEETITVQSLDILHKFAVRNNKVFNEVIKPKLLEILENLPKIKITGPGKDTYEYSTLKLLSLLYWIKVWDTDSLNFVEAQLLHNEYNNGDHCKFIYDTLRMKSVGVFE